ncbi:hypothetical protein COL05_26020 [Bacillus sp. AFS059628]|uniref:hypothetical protein n=1 Tax=Bacillus sp. AFS059628 TaxID=2033508 RepID=UPI000BF560B8|nr:hypothetical protein [Bacillus sp. AFS059628]PFV72745.1 hypothetical protein COL05_26020 [Bacillus sp. AFS059628]
MQVTSIDKERNSSCLISIYQKFLDSVLNGKTYFPLASSETFDKVLKLRGNQLGPEVFVANLPENFSGMKIEEAQVFINQNRSSFPVQHNGVVVGCEDDVYLLESALFALVTGRQWVGVKKWDDIQFYKELSPSSFLIFGALDNFYQKNISKLINLLSKEVDRSRWMEFPFGLMTGATRDVLLYMIYKNLYYPTELINQPLYLNTFALNQKHYNDRHVKLITRDECDVEKLDEHLSEFRELTVFSGHGHEDCFFLGKVSIFPAGLRDGKIVENNSDLPLSAYGRGETDPDVVYTDQFRTKVFFANTCCGLHLTDGLFPSQFGVGMSFLEGEPAAFISTFMVKDNSEHDPLLFSRLALQYGMRVGEAVRLVNNLLFQDTNDFPCYLLVGDPEMKFSHPVAKPILGKLSVNEDRNSMTLEAEVEGGFLIVIDLPDEPQAKTLNNKRVRLQEILFNQVGVKADPRFLLHEQTLYLYSTKPMPAGIVQIVMEVVREEALAKLYFDIDDYLVRLEYLNAMRLFEQKYKGLAEEVNNSIKSISPLYKPSLFSLKQAEKYTKLMNRINLNFQRLQESIIETYLSKVEKGSWAFTEMYSDEFLPISRKMLDQDCPYCKNQLLQKKIVHPIYQRLQRELTICPRCGIIKDCPESSFSVNMQGLESIRQGETLTKIVTYTNPTNAVKLVTIGLGVERTKLAHFPFNVQNSMQTRIVQPGETVEFRFEIKINEECVAHSFYLKAFLLSNMEIACLHNILFVLPAREGKI